MIEIEILNSPDKNIDKVYTFDKDIIIFGRNKGDVLIYDDLQDPHFIIEIDNDNLYASPNPQIESYLTNGKKTIRKRMIQVGDEIQIANTKFIIKSFKHESVDYENIIKGLYPEFHNTQVQSINTLKQIIKNDLDLLESEIKKLR